MPDSTLAKRTLRTAIRERRRATTAADRGRAAEGIARQLHGLVHAAAARTISAYLSTEDEPSTRTFLPAALAEGVRILLPISRSDGGLDWAAYDGADEVADPMGMPSPTGDALGPRAVDDVDLILAPAAAVDLSGMRLGWGKGYFDRALESIHPRPAVYAVIFDSELVESVPHEPHDARVDGVVTPTRTIRFAGSN